MRRSQLTCVLTASLTTVILMMEGSIEAASRWTVDLTDLLKMADAVVRVHVTAQHVEEDEHGLISTVVTMRLEKVFKGALAEGSVIEAVYLGGTISGRIQVAPGEPALVPNQSAVLLLVGNASCARWKILGGDAGQIALYPAANVHTVARRGSGRFEFYVADSTSITGFRAVKCETVYSTQLDSLLHAVIATGRPVLETPNATPELPPQTTVVCAADVSWADHFWRLLMVVLVTGAVLLNARQARSRVRK